LELQTCFDVSVSRANKAQPAGVRIGAWTPNLGRREPFMMPWASMKKNWMPFSARMRSMPGAKAHSGSQIPRGASEVLSVVRDRGPDLRLRSSTNGR
jgi:hypothetical protein